MELKDIVLDSVICSILKTTKARIKSKDCYKVFLCERRSFINTGKINFCELTEKKRFFEKVQNGDMLESIINCYLKKPFIEEENSCFARIPSKIGSLGVVFLIRLSLLQRGYILQERISDLFEKPCLRWDMEYYQAYVC